MCATLSELIKAQHQQRSARVPVKTWKTDSGDVLSDLWVFDLDTETWIEETAKTYVADAGLYVTCSLFLYYYRDHNLSFSLSVTIASYPGNAKY